MVDTITFIVRIGDAVSQIIRHQDLRSTAEKIERASPANRAVSATPTYEWGVW